MTLYLNLCQVCNQAPYYGVRITKYPPTGMCLKCSKDLADYTPEMLLRAAIVKEERNKADGQPSKHSQHQRRQDASPR